jgi:purine-binding chemotaxis protein CheW
MLLVELGDTLCGLDAAAVREIVPLLPATRLPGAPPWVRGVVNLRGQLLTVLDLRQRLTGTSVAGSDASTVVVEDSERILGLLVDDVRDVTALPVQPSSEATLAEAAGLVTGLGRLDDEVVLVIDVPELVRQTLA